MRSIRFPFVTSILSLTALLGIAAVAPAQTDVSSAKLPGPPNAMMTLDIERLLQSPMAKQMDWQSKMIKGQADRPLAVSAAAKRVTIAAALHPYAMQTIWQAAIVDLPSAPRLEPMLKAQGGYLDMIGGAPAAWTPRDIFYVQLGAKTLGIVRPGHRQLVSRWLNAKTAAEFTPYLKKAQADSGNAEVVFAIDLKDMVGSTAVRYAYDSGELPSLEGLPADARKRVIAALGGVTGIRLNIHAKQTLSAELIADFEGDIGGLGDQAKALVIDVLKSVELYQSTADAWQFKASGKTITGVGDMAPDALSRLLALLAPGNSLEADQAEATGATAAAPNGAAAPAPANAGPTAAASQRYYKAVSAILDGLSAKASPTEGATWLIAKGRQIQQMPILGVDPELVAWGGTVTEAVNRAAQELGLGQQKAKMAALGVASPTGYTDYADNGGGSESADTRAAFRNAQDQRRQAAQTERGAAAERALNIFNELLPTRSKIRADMTQKYGVEF